MPLRNNYKELTESDLPEYIYIDTSFIIHAIINTEIYHTEAINFLKSLELKQPIVIFSDLLIPELRCAVLTICLRSDYGDKIKVMQLLGKNPLLIRRYTDNIETAEKSLWAIMERFENRMTIPIKEKYIKNSGILMNKYCLGSYDAIHVASMEDYNIKDIAVMDKGLEDLPHHNKDYRIWTIDGFQRYKNRHHLKD